MTGAGGALLLEEGEGAHERFARHALEILFSPERLEAMSVGARRAGRRDGAGRILELILEDMGGTKV
jgi:UDP-N-acetylglucosamine:LPS N-acetylglucosamine transferase